MLSCRHAAQQTTRSCIVCNVIGRHRKQAESPRRRARGASGPFRRCFVGAIHHGELGRYGHRCFGRGGARGACGGPEPRHRVDPNDDDGRAAGRRLFIFVASVSGSAFTAARAKQSHSGQPHQSRLPLFPEVVPVPNGPAGQLTFQGSPIKQTENQFMIKFDYTRGRHQIAGRYYFTDFDGPPVIPKDNVLAASSTGNAVRLQNISINHNFALSPGLLINSTFGLNRQRGGSLSSAPFSFRDAGVAIEGPETSSLKAPPELVVSVTGGFSINTNVANTQARRIYPVFGRVLLYQSSGNSRYQSGESRKWLTNPSALSNWA